MDPDSELIDEAVATPANSSDRQAADELLAEHADAESKPQVVGDSAYADGATRARLGEAGYEVMAKCPPVRNSTGGFPKDRFRVDLDAKEVTCPAGHSAPIRMSRKGGGRASFAPHCHGCPLRAGCTSGPKGRSIAIGPHEKLLQAARAEQTTQRWARRYRADRPVVERKIAHFVRRVWGGRQARARGRERVATDLDTRAAAINWSRLARLGLGWGFGGWALTS